MYVTNCKNIEIRIPYLIHKTNSRFYAITIVVMSNSRPHGGMGWLSRNPFISINIPYPINCVVSYPYKDDTGNATVPSSKSSNTPSRLMLQKKLRQ